MKTLVFCSYHGSKTKLKTPSRGRSAKTKRSQPPPLFPTPHREADLGHNNDEHSTFGGGEGSNTFCFPSFCDCTMAQKTKNKNPSRTQKRRARTVKTKKSPPPPLFPTSHMEAELGCNDDEPTLKDMRMALGSFRVGSTQRQAG